MTKISIIGAGHIGGLLAAKLSERFGPKNVYLSTRTQSKADLLHEKYGVNVCAGNISAAQSGEIVFLCVKPVDTDGVLNEIKPALAGTDKILISAVSDYPLSKLKEMSGITAVRIIPSVTLEYGRGIMVISFAEETPKSMREYVTSLFDGFSRPHVADEKYISVLSDAASSSPGLISSLMENFSLAASKASSGGISEEEAFSIIKEVFVGCALIFDKGGKSFSELTESVATKGGITAEGVKVIEEMSGGMYDKVFSAMKKKHYDVENMKTQ